MLCRLCNDIFFNVNSQISTTDGAVHHPSYAALEVSASSCQLCSYLQLKLVEKGEDTLHISAKEATQRQQHLDEQEDSQFYITLHSSVHSGRKTTLVDFYDYFVYERYQNGKTPASIYHEVNSLANWRLKIKLALSDNSYARCIGRTVSVDPDIGLAKTWLEQCQSQHHCDKGLESLLPSRCIDISGTPRLVQEKGKLSRYAALTHCWGVDTSPPKTLKSNLEAHLVALPELPQTFQDAIQVARQLGFQYIWIDSLCIIQDDAMDWQVEAANMDQVYARASLTVAGPGAVDSYAGFLKPRDVTKPDLVLNLADGVSIELRSLPSEYPHIDEDKTESPAILDRRGWCLQERLLSQRIIYFGSRQMYWECNKTTCYEDAHGSYFYDDLKSLDQFSKDVPFELGSSKNYQAWYEMESNFSIRKLTRGDDSLPALSGLASRFSECTNDTYCAGLWREDLVFGLTWYRNTYFPGERWIVPPRYSGPTWSWPSCEHVFAHLDSRRSAFVPTVSILSVDIKNIGIDPFGMVESGVIRLEGKLKQATVHPKPNGYEDEVCIRDTENNALVGAGIVDDIHASGKMEVVCLHLGSVVDVSIHDYLPTALRSGKIDESNLAWFALLLQPAENAGQSIPTYRRIGLMTTLEGWLKLVRRVDGEKERDPMKEQQISGWFESAAVQEICLV